MLILEKKIKATSIFRGGFCAVDFVIKNDKKFFRIYRGREEIFSKYDKKL